MNKDITYCISSCDKDDCFRHFKNIEGDPFDHAFAFLFGKEGCPRIESMEENCEGGLYIKGFRSPKICGGCLFCEEYLSGSAICLIGHRDVELTQKDDKCPLIEVEPHGRLIDADKLIDELMPDPVTEMGCPEPEFLQDLINVLEASPVVLE